jgi:beta-glucosidase
MTKAYCPFPKDFTWGVATASYQVEGAVAEDGRTPSVWDTFTRRPGAIVQGQTGDRAVDHYHRYKEDVALMRRLGIKAYRFSSSWSRVVPSGRGSINQKGLDYYDRLVDELLAAKIEPWLTLFHWDLPQWAEDQYRGWESKQCALDLADYATLICKRLGDRLSGVFTTNEFFCFLDKAYTANGEIFAPGKVVSRKVLNQARHHAIYGHGLAAQAVRVVCKAPIGLAENIPNIVPALETTEDIAAAREALREISGMYLTPIMEGKYHPAYIENEKADVPVFTEAEMMVIRTPLDFIGINLYAPTYIRHDPSAPRGWREVPCDDNYPKMHMPWLNIGPSITYWGPRLCAEAWNPRAIYITENGCAYPDKPNAQNQIDDIARVMFLQNHLIHLHRAVAEGIAVKGYFLWSLLDNFEWAFGYTKRFGICYVDYQTMQRIPKLSARFYSEVIRSKAVGGW